jgi:hypothetical protein
MTLTIDLPSELERYLLREAQAQGISLETMTLRVLANSIPMLDSIGSANKKKPATALKQPRVFGQYQGRIRMSEDFDEPLPDAFWLGES